MENPVICPIFNINPNQLEIDSMIQKNRKSGFAIMFITFDKDEKILTRCMSRCALFIAFSLATVQVFGWDSGEGTSIPILYFLLAAFIPRAIKTIAGKF